MSSGLFVYGSLMFPEVFSIVLGRTVQNEDLSDATLTGYRRIAVPGRTYPTGIVSSGSLIRGKLIRDLSDADLERLDAYEESFYVRKTVDVQTSKGMEEAFAYIDGRNPLPFECHDWNPETFEKTFPAFISKLRAGWKREERIL